MHIGYESNKNCFCRIRTKLGLAYYRHHVLSLLPQHEKSVHAPGCKNKLKTGRINWLFLRVAVYLICVSLDLSLFGSYFTMMVIHRVRAKRKV